MSDDFHANNDAAISRLEDTVRELETRHETLTAKLSNPTEEMMLAGALAHNENLRPMRAAITASEAKKIFLAMIAYYRKRLWYSDLGAFCHSCDPSIANSAIAFWPGGGASAKSSI